ncbi:MAG: hypothetical protein R3C53_04725 [Pirellulaceae bacterium]
MITLDGLRLEEVFTGADQRLMIEELGVKEPDVLVQRYIRPTPQEQRAALMPFLWSRVGKDGWIAGDVLQDSIVKVTNGLYFSYPGYNELLTGRADARVNSNAKRYNDNLTVLEWLLGQPEIERVAAYCSWDVFPFIINDHRSQVYVNAGWTPLTVGVPEVIAELNFAAENLFHEWEGVRYDAFTTAGALQEMKQQAPRVLYVALGETDDWAHAGRYDRYLLSAQQNDFFISQLWNATQGMDAYRDNTTFIVTSDHGRGDGRNGWKSHSLTLPGSERIWVAAFGAGVQRLGIDQGGKYEQAQIAATVANAIGYDFAASAKEIAPPLPIFKPQ